MREKSCVKRLVEDDSLMIAVFSCMRTGFQPLKRQEYTPHGGAP